MRDGKERKRTVFVRNSLSNYWNDEDLYYCERGFSHGPFNIFLEGKTDTIIPVTMEYKNGINEYTLRDVDLEKAEDVFKEIGELVDSKTKLVYTTSGYKSGIKEYSHIAEKRNLEVVKRLIQICK